MLGNLIEEVAGPPGAGLTVTLDGPTEGSVGWYNAIPTGSLVYYVLTDGIQAEAGIGTYTLGPPSTISRDTVLWTSASGRNNPIRLTFETQVWVRSDLPAERALWRNPVGNVDMAGRLVTNLSPGVQSGDAVRLDQLAWRLLGNHTMGVDGFGDATFGLPSTMRRFRLEYEEMQGSTEAFLFLRFSNDNGQTWHSGSTDYAQVLTTMALPGNVTTGGGDSGSVTLSPTTTLPITGYAEFSAGDVKLVMGTSAGVTTTIYRCDSAGLCKVAGVANAVQIGFAYPAYAIAGRIRLLGAPA